MAFGGRAHESFCDPKKAVYVKFKFAFSKHRGSITWVNPWLPAPIQEQFQLAYLLWRLVDTVEDCANWPRANRIVTLQQCWPCCKSHPYQQPKPF